MLLALMHHPDFEAMLHKHVSPSAVRNVNDRIKALETKGLPDRPSESTSARARRSGHGSRSGSMTRGNSASRFVSRCCSFPDHFPSPLREMFHKTKNFITTERGFVHFYPPENCATIRTSRVFFIQVLNFK